MTSTAAQVSRPEERVGPPGWPHFFLFAFALLLLPGCRRCDLVETELRSRERQLRETQDELDVAAVHNDAMQRELSAWRQGLIGQPGVGESTTRPGVGESTTRPGVRETQPQPGVNESSQFGPGPALPGVPALENFSLPNTIKEVVLGRQTGGYDDDRCPGDDAIQVVIEPRDQDGHALKVPGCLRVTALEILPQGLKQPLCSWDVPAEQLRRNWKSGMLGTGYYVVLPWKAWPSTEKLRIVAQFTLADGRPFEADKDITVRLPPLALRKPLPPPGPVLTEPGPSLPQPRRLDTPVSNQTNKPVVPAFIYTGIQLLPPQPLP